jgi:hypothetical protein
VKNRRIRRLWQYSGTLLACMLVVTVWSVVRAPVEPATSPLVVNDVTQLNPVGVSRVITPTTTDEIIERTGFGMSCGTSTIIRIDRG